MFVVEINCVVCTYCIKESGIVSDVKRRLDDVIERKLERVDIVLIFELGLTLTDYEDCIDCTEDEESSISSIFSSLVNEFDCVYVKCDVSSISMTWSVISYRICSISRSAGS